MSSLRMVPKELDSLRARLDTLESRRSKPVDMSPWDWYGETCPCGLEAGACRLHPRARGAQRPPSGDWRTWLFQAGRGSGKTRAGAEWVRGLVESGRARRIALVGATAADVRDVMVGGESGILAISPPWNMPKYEPSKRRLTWPNGAVALCFSAEEPERLRGPQSDAAWCDEVGAWMYAATWDNLMLGLRLGSMPRVLVTSTPRTTQLLKRIIGEKTTAITRGTTFDNRTHLAEAFFSTVVAVYEGTRLGLQEVYGELLEIADGAWFTAFNPAKHVSVSAEYDPALPVRLAIDCGVSMHTGAVFLQTREISRDRYRVTVFADYYREGAYSEANALAIKATADRVCGGQIDLVRLDPAATARSGVGPAASGEYQRVFDKRKVGYWPRHLVADGLDQLELLLGGETREPDLIIHPRCVHLIDAFKNCHRAQRAGQWLDYPEDSQHPWEDMMDALRGGVRDAYPVGRRPRPEFLWVPARRVLP